jgi:hypothetical protein
MLLKLLIVILEQLNNMDLLRQRVILMTEQPITDLECIIELIEESIVLELLDSCKEKQDTSSLIDDEVVSLKTASYVDYDK